MKKFFLTGISAVIGLYTFAQGTVGIGTPTPGSKLQINNNSNIRPSVKLFDSTADNGYPEIQFQNAGGTNFWQIGGNINNGTAAKSYFDIFSSQAGVYLLTVRGDGNVGIGSTTPQSKLDVAGDINVTGALKVAGNAGTAGQVLASNGAAAPAWRSAALSNNTRFSANIPSGTGDGSMNFTTIYNTNTADVSIGSGSIVINHTGLYHFEGLAFSTVDLSAPQTFPPRVAISMQVGATTYSLLYGSLTTQTTSIQYLKSEKFIIELYITAGTTLSLSKAYSFGGSTSTSGWFTGYLISD